MDDQATDPDAALDAAAARLIADARLLQRYLADTGKLADTALGDAIDALGRSRGTPEAERCLALLSVQYSKAIGLTDKTAIAALRDEHRRLHPNLHPNLHSELKQMATASIAIVLIFFAVLGFVIVQDLNDNIAQLQRINLQNPLQKLTELRRIIDEGALNDPKSAYYIQYLKAHHEVSLMFESANQILDRTAASSRRRALGNTSAPASTVGENEIGLVSQIYNIVAFALVGPAPATPAAAPTSADATPGAVPGLAPRVGKPASDLPASAAGAGTGSPGQRPLMAAGVGGTVEGVYDTGHPRIDATNCKPYDDAPVRKLLGSANQQFLRAALDQFGDFCLAETLGIQTGSYRPASAIHTVRVLQDQLFMIGVLFLPLIGGLLGATISIIYAIINKTQSTALSVGYLAVRIVVGGAFGVIIGWFSATGSGSSADFVEHVSGTPFTLAILAGFSVQSLSMVLLSFSRSLDRQADRRPPPGPAKPAG